MKLFSWVTPIEVQTKPKKAKYSSRLADYIKVLLWCIHNSNPKLFYTEREYVVKEVPVKNPVRYKPAKVQDTNGEWHDTPENYFSTTDKKIIGVKKSIHINLRWPFTKDNIKAGYFALATGEL